MFADHEQFPSAVPDDQVVWRYMDLARFTSLLQTRTLWFCRADLLGDPHEGASSAFNPTQWAELYGEDAAAIAATMTAIDWRPFIQEFHISCWHMNDRESAAMWGLYQKDGRGLAVKSTIGRLKAALMPAPDDIYFAPVTYIDYQTEFLPEANLFFRVMHKRKSFEHELELRLMISRHPPSKGDLRRDPAWIPDPGVAALTDVATVIEAVHIAPGSPTWFGDVVRRLVINAGLTSSVLQSELDAKPLF